MISCGKHWGSRAEGTQRMMGVYRSVCLLVGSFLRILSPAKGDAEVSCVFMESCILPCSFPSGSKLIIHWIQVTAGNTPVHSYYSNQDQLTQQDQRFRGRTSLFKDQISRGNASLQLTRVEVQDQGRYKCYTGTIYDSRESFINLKVDALVRKVDIQQVGNRITCSSEGIYPEPELTWSTSPPSTETFSNTTTVQKTEQQLYNISSSLILSHSLTDLDFSCNISTRRNWRRATLRQSSPISGSHIKTTIPCTASNTSIMGFSLVWRFDHSHVILNQTGTNASHSVSEQWRHQVKGVSESGSLMLQNLSMKQEGMYTCELHNVEETYTSNIFLRTEKGSQTHDSSVTVGVVVGVVLVVLLTGLVLYCKRRKELFQTCYHQTCVKEESCELRQSQVVEE